MPLVKTISQNEGQIGIWKITESIGELENCFSKEILMKGSYPEMKNSQRQKEWLATRLLLQKMANGAQIEYSEEGKPKLLHDSFKYISISHSGCFVVVYLHKNQEVGIDIENLNRNYQKIAGKYLSQKELDQVKNDTNLLCLYWCAKEAIFKLVKDNGIDFRKQIHILSSGSKQLNSMIARFTIHEEKTFYQLKFEAIDNYFMVWAENEPIDHKLVL